MPSARRRGFALPAAFAWGVLSVALSPCHLSSVPLVVAYMSGGAELPSGRGALWISSAFAAGILGSIALIGMVTAAAGRMLGDVGRFGQLARRRRVPRGRPEPPRPAADAIPRSLPRAGEAPGRGWVRCSSAFSSASPLDRARSPSWRRCSASRCARAAPALPRTGSCSSGYTVSGTRRHRVRRHLAPVGESLALLEGGCARDCRGEGDSRRRGHPRRRVLRMERVLRGLFDDDLAGSRTPHRPGLCAPPTPIARAPAGGPHHRVAHARARRWAALYGTIQPLSEVVAYRVLGLSPESHLGQSVEFFLYDTPKVLLLLVLVVFAVGIVRSFFTPERTRAHARRASASRSATSWPRCSAIVTPFCSCSAVPLFIGFVEAGVPLGVTLLVPDLGADGQRGRPRAALRALRLEDRGALPRDGARHRDRRRVDDRPARARALRGAVGLRGDARRPAGDEARAARVRGPHRRRASRRCGTIVGKVWPYVLAGIAVGAGIHGYVPENFMAAIMGKGGVVVGAAGGADRRPDVLERGGDHPGRPGAAREGRGARDGARLHDGGDRRSRCRR